MVCRHDQPQRGAPPASDDHNDSVLTVKVGGAGAEGFLQRIISEAKARRFEADGMAGSTSALEPLYRENLLQEVKSPNFADLIAEAIAPHRQWTAVYLNTIVRPT